MSRAAFSTCRDDPSGRLPAEPGAGSGPADGSLPRSLPPLWATIPGAGVFERGGQIGRPTIPEPASGYPALRMAYCEHHYVFCLPRDKVPALIVAVLDERIDLMVRLADRLNKPER